MEEFSIQGQKALRSITVRYGISFDSACSLLEAVSDGYGSMAKFDIPELGRGLWLQGGMTICEGAYDEDLVDFINDLCGEMSELSIYKYLYKMKLARFEPTPPELRRKKEKLF